MSNKIDALEAYGYFKMIIFSILLLVSPLYGLTEYDLFTKESYYDGSQRLYYGRQIYEYIIVILITVHTINAF